MNRQSGRFILSVGIAGSAYASMFYAAPHIVILRPNAAAPEAMQSFRVKLRDPVPAPVFERPPPQDDAAPRPSTVQELLDDELGQLSELPERPEAEPPIARLEERVGKDDPSREFHFEKALPSVASIDAKILEIAQEAARMELNVPRRLVRPSSPRVLERGELPVLRMEGLEIAGGADPAFGLPPLPVPQTMDVDEEAAGDTLEIAEPDELRPKFEEGVINDEFVEEEGLPRLPIEMTMARAPLEAEIRRESVYEFMDDLVRIELETYVPPGEDRGFFRVRVAPREATSMDVLPKDVTFVVDASKSIMQRKLNLTARGLARCLAMLHPEDRFNIVVFRDSPQPFRSEMTRATDSAKAAAVNYIRDLESRGETDVYRAVRPVVEAPRRKGVASVILVMSDGRPTKGVLRARDIINTLTEDNTQRKSIYAFGGGRTVNRYLLDLLAYRNKGESFFAPKMDTIDESLTKFFERVNDPVLIDLSADYGRIDEAEVYPKEIPDFYRGRMVQVYGQFVPDRDLEFVMRLEGVAGEGKKELVFKAELSRANTGDESIARDWAFQKVYYLIGEICRVGETPELLGELRALSRKYDIETSYSR